MEEQSWRLGGWQGAARHEQGPSLGHVKLDIPAVLWATLYSPAKQNFHGAFWF